MKKLTKIQETNLVDSYVDLNDKIKTFEEEKKIINKIFMAENEKTGQIKFSGSMNDLEISIPEKCLFDIENLLLTCSNKIAMEHPDLSEIDAVRKTFDLFRTIVKVDLTESKRVFGNVLVESFGKKPDTKKLLVKKHK